MIVGDKSKFAIEWKLRCKAENKKHFYFVFWSQNRIIGDFENDVMDSIISGYIKVFLENRDTRYKHNFSELDKVGIYNVIYTSFFGNSDKKYSKNSKKLLNSLDPRAVFHLNDIGGTSFDCFEIICCKISDKEQSLIWKDLSADKLYETHLPLGYVEDVMNEFLEKEFG